MSRSTNAGQRDRGNAVGSSVSILPITARRRPGVLALRVQPENKLFVLPPSVVLPRSEAAPGEHPYAICAQDGAPVGFLAVEELPNSGIPEVTTVLLRGFMIGADHQGRGYARQALHVLPAALVEDFPCLCVMHLSVAVSNVAARTLYESAGFEEVGVPPTNGRGGKELLFEQLVDGPRWMADGESKDG